MIEYLSYTPMQKQILSEWNNGSNARDIAQKCHISEKYALRVIQLEKRTQTGTKVKCLGPAEPEHYFQSTDPKYNRVCGMCAYLISVLEGGEWTEENERQILGLSPHYGRYGCGQWNVLKH